MPLEITPQILHADSHQASETEYGHTVAISPCAARSGPTSLSFFNFSISVVFLTCDKNRCNLVQQQDRGSVPIPYSFQGTRARAEIRGLTLFFLIVACMQILHWSFGSSRLLSHKKWSNSFLRSHLLHRRVHFLQCRRGAAPPSTILRQSAHCSVFRACTEMSLFDMPVSNASSNVLGSGNNIGSPSSRTGTSEILPEECAIGAKYQIVFCDSKFN